MDPEITQPITENTSNTQVTQEQQQAQEPQAQNGIQARIDELVAKQRGAERQAALLAEQNAKLTEAMTQMVARQIAPVAPTPTAPALPEGFDPSWAAAFEQIAKQTFTPYAKQLEAQVALVRQQQEQAQLTAAAAQLPDDVKSRAPELMQAWRNGGYTGWNPDDAAVYALGEKVKAALQTGNSELRKALFGTNAQIAAAVRNQPVPQMMQSAPPPAAPKPVVVPELPEDFDMTDPGNAAKAYAFYAKKLGL